MKRSKNKKIFQCRLKLMQLGKYFRRLSKYYDDDYVILVSAYADIIAMGIFFFSFRFKYFKINSIVHARMQIKMQTLCEWMQMGKEPVRSRMKPMSGPKMMTKIALPTMCHPNAAGSFSSDEYSLTVRVKLLKAIPRKNPAIQSQAIIEEISVCSAKTRKKVRVNLALLTPKQSQLT